MTIMENKVKESNWDDVGVEERSFLKMKSNMEKDGYREGIEEGRNKVFQKYFDEGYKDGFKNGFLLGRLKGALWAEQIIDQKDSIKVAELENSSNGACIICKDEKTISLPVCTIKSKQTEMLKSSIVNIESKTEMKTI